MHFQRKLSCLLGILCAFDVAAQVSFDFTTSRRGPLLSPLQYGIFYEEINHGGDGGLYAELIRNRSFEDDASSPTGWQGVGTMTSSLVTSGLLNEAQSYALKLTIKKAGGGIRNEGFWGMNIVEGDTYRLSFWAKTDATVSGKIVAELQDKARHSLGSTELDVALTSEWQKFSVELTADSSSTKGWLALKGQTPMTIYLDVVSLMPPTYKGRENGCRRDLAEMLEALHPTFVRFPGGCYIEGTWRDGQTNRFEWKKTIGPIESRPGHQNVNWGYRVSDGLGLHELLQLTEDLGAEPLFVANIGLGHGWMQDYQNLSGYIQETLDLIEYCNGDISTTYGALRAANGHPMPFGLRLIEIGNENYNFSFNNNNDQSDHYAERYRKFYDAIKEKYPEMLLIGNVEAWGTDNPSWRNGNPVDAVDEHYYRSTSWFSQQYNKYDGYNREGHKVYAGEYAVTSDFGTVGHLDAALAEAIYMAGMERNSDVCIMASYAPIFCNENHTSPWMPDMIRFNAAASFGTPSYWVQQMMAANVGHQNITWQEEGNGIYAAAGGIALSSWSTSVSYDNVKVVDGEGTLVYSSDFSSADEYAEHWQLAGGSWNITGETLNQTSTSAQGQLAICQLSLGENYTVELDATKQSGNEGFLVAFSFDDASNYVWWNIGGWNNTQHAIEQCVEGSKRTLTTTSGTLQTGKTYHLRIQKSGLDVYCYIDGELCHHITLPDARKLYACAALTEAEDTLVVKLINMGQQTETTLRFSDFQRAGEVQQQVLTSESGTDENSMDAPAKVVPASSSFLPADEDEHIITYSVPAHSLCILRIPVANVAPEAVPEPTEDDWTDITDHLLNPTFAEGQTGWAGTSFAACPGTVAEFYNQTFDTYQILEDMPAGSYRFTLDGFYRYGSKQVAWAAHSDGTERLLPDLYITAGEVSRQSSFMSIYCDEAPYTYAPDYTYPDNVTQANLAFNIKGAYRTNVVEAEVRQNGSELRIGMRKTLAQSTDWTCFDNAHLYYKQPADPTSINSPKPQKNSAGEGIYTLQGQKISAIRSPGIYIKGGQKVVRNK